MSHHFIDFKRSLNRIIYFLKSFETHQGPVSRSSVPSKNPSLFYWSSRWSRILIHRISQGFTQKNYTVFSATQTEKVCVVNNIWMQRIEFLRQPRTFDFSPSTLTHVETRCRFLWRCPSIKASVWSIIALRRFYFNLISFLQPHWETSPELLAP